MVSPLVGPKSGRIRRNPRRVSRRQPSTPEVQNAPLDVSFPIAMVGASAGGLEAFTALLKALPADTGAGFVLIQHLEPSHESALAKILSRNTLMPIREVVDGVAVERNHVYVIPPNKNMTIRQGILRLAPREETSGPHRPIDGFALALAEEHKSAAIGIVLSGTGSDGTLGLKAIKTAGGITFAQDPTTAQWPEMPTNAISAGAVDFVLPPKRIAEEFARIGKHPYLMASVHAPAGGDLEKICMVLRARTGVDFQFYNHATVSRRIARRMMLAKIGSLEEYVQFLKQSPVEAEALANDIFIHVTGFFRDPECFQALRKQVFRHLRKRSHEDPIRVWVPGCSTGEEVYSIAMLLLEDLGDCTKQPRIQLFGTDVSESSIEHARAGIYSESAVIVPTPARLKRYFREVEGGYQVTKEVRDVCVFARHDLTKDPPFSKLDLISCRNVLIYMGPALQERALSIFQYALKPTGFLFLGKSESVSACPESFSVEDRTHKIFARNPTGALRRFDFPKSGYHASDAFLAANGRPVDSVADFRKEAQQISETSRQRISALAASLLRAQEKERRRISRELHDTLCQQLASLAFDVGDLAAQTSPSDVARSHLRNIQARVVRMSEEVRHIAYQLHPSELDDLGLSAALQALCDEVSKRHRITIKVASNDVSKQLPLELASCLYRVCQEGLNNMAKHSKAKRASVTFIEEHGSVALSIKDDGVGFRVEAVEGKGGLGIIGMKERARIVNGNLSIQTEPGKGTTIELVVPLPLSV